MRTTPTTPIAIPALAPVDRPGAADEEGGGFAELLALAELVGAEEAEEIDVPLEEAIAEDADACILDTRLDKVIVLLVISPFVLLALTVAEVVKLIKPVAALDIQLATAGMFVTPLVAHICCT